MVQGVWEFFFLHLTLKCDLDLSFWVYDVNIWITKLFEMTELYLNTFQNKMFYNLLFW